MADLHRVKDFIQRTMGAIKKAQDAGDQEGVLRNTAFLDRAIPLAERSVAQAKAQPQEGQVPLPAPVGQDVTNDPARVERMAQLKAGPTTTGPIPQMPGQPGPHTVPGEPGITMVADYDTDTVSPKLPEGSKYIGETMLPQDDRSMEGIDLPAQAKKNPWITPEGNRTELPLGKWTGGPPIKSNVPPPKVTNATPPSPDAPTSVAPALPIGTDETREQVSSEMTGKLLQDVAANVETDVEAEAIKRISKELGDSKGQNIGELIVTLLLMGAPRAFSMAMQRKSEYQRGVKAIYDKIRAEIEHRKDRDANAGFRGRELASTEARTAVMKQNADARPEMGENRDLQSAARAIISNPSIPEDSQQKQWAYRMIGAPVLPAQPK